MYQMTSKPKAKTSKKTIAIAIVILAIVASSGIIAYLVFAIQPKQEPPKLKPPSSPVLANSVLGTSVLLSWDFQKEIDNYEIFHGVKSDFSDAVSIAKVIGTTGFYTDSTARSNGVNFYRLIATNAIGAATSNVNTVNMIVGTVTGTTTPSSPVLSASSSMSQVVLSWNSQNGVTTYKIYRAFTSALADATILSTITSSITTYIDNVPKYGANYYYIVAVYATGSVTSNVLTVNAVNSVVPNAPGGFYGNPNALLGYGGPPFATGIGLGWIAPAANLGGALLGYHIYKDGVLVATTTLLAWTSGVLVPNNPVPTAPLTCVFYITAFNAAGESVHTKSLSFVFSGGSPGNPGSITVS